MEIDNAKEKDLQKKLRRESLKRNWKLFSQSKLGMIGLGIVSLFLILALLQPFLFLTGIWSESIYHPVVGYDQIIEEKLVVECPKEYPTPKYETSFDCPAEGEVQKKMLYLAQGVEVGDMYDVYLQPAPPSSKHILGTDSLGRDVFSQIMEGSQVAFVLGLLSATLGVGISTILGTINN